MAVEHPNRLNCTVAINVTVGPLVLTAQPNSVRRLEFNTGTNVLTVVPQNNPSEVLTEVTNRAGTRDWKFLSATIVGDELQVAFLCMDLAGAAAAPVADDVHICIFDGDSSQSMGALTIPQVQA